MGHDFDLDTAVTPVPAETGAPGVFRAEMSDGWLVGAGVNGGYQLATIARALGDLVPGKPHPFSITAHYLSATRPGPATIETRVVRNGGSVATLAADMVQDGTPRLTVLATYGDLGALPREPVRTTHVRPELPPVEECFATAMAPEQVRRMAPLMDRFEMRIDPAYAGWAVGKPGGEGVMQAWFRLAEDRDHDPLSLLLTADALPPVTFELGMPGWAPTIELTVHLRAMPAPGWAIVRHETRNLAGGMFEEDAVIWDSAGRLVAQSRQLARLPRPQ